MQSAVQQINETKGFPEVPLFVISGDKKPFMMPENAYQIRKSNQLKFVHLNRHSKQIYTTKSGNFPQITEPEIVINVIKECIIAAKEHLQLS